MPTVLYFVIQSREIFAEFDVSKNLLRFKVCPEWHRKRPVHLNQMSWKDRTDEFLTQKRAVDLTLLFSTKACAL